MSEPSKEVWKWWLHNKQTGKWRRCNNTPDYPTKEEAMKHKLIPCGENEIPTLLRESEDCFTAYLERSQTIDRTTANP